MLESYPSLGSVQSLRDHRPTRSAPRRATTPRRIDVRLMAGSFWIDRRAARGTARSFVGRQIARRRRCRRELRRWIDPPRCDARGARADGMAYRLLYRRRALICAAGPWAPWLSPD